MKEWRIFKLVRLATIIGLFFTYLQFSPPAAAGAPNLPLDVQTPPQLEHISAISTGGFHTCALTDTGGVKCWGQNYDGQLGDGTFNSSSKPVDVSGLTNGVTAVTAGSKYSCAINSLGGIKCWGNNTYGQLGDGTTEERLTPVDVIGLTSGVIAIQAGGDHTCALTTGGGVKCWGRNPFGQLGDGTTDNQLTPVDVSGLASDVAMIAVSPDFYYGHTCALTNTGGVKCWGYNGDGQLGDNSITNRPTPVDVNGLTGGVSSVTAGYLHTCALTTSGGVKCWGNNSSGQLGDGTDIIRIIPQDVSGLTSGVASITAGRFHTCAVTDSGGAKCWGFNATSQLGIETQDPQYTPLDVSSLSGGVLAIDAGGADFDIYTLDHTCALTDSGTVKCWGSNAFLELGNGDSYTQSHPVDVRELEIGILTMSTGVYHTCAVTAAHGAKCWGDNSSGQLGDGTGTGRSLPVDVDGLTTGVITITAGEWHTCALTGTGGVKCWGSNNEGQLGDGSSSPSPVPVDVSGLTSGMLAVEAGYRHTCALTATAGVKCWGNNDWGQLGDGTNSHQPTPVDVNGLTSGVAAISADAEHTCALTSTGGVKCWGRNNYGQLGDGTAFDSNTPVDVSGLSSGVSRIATGNRHTCALMNSGGVRCWGHNEGGQLGDGTTTNSPTPVDVSGMTAGMEAITAGDVHTCAMTTYGRVNCWGGNFSGQLGDGTFTDQLTPVTVEGLASGATAVAAGDEHTCALVGSGRLKCWGSDYSGLIMSSAGQLGQGKVAQSFLPVDVVTGEPWMATNYPNGQPGSFFTLTGHNFPPGGTATVTIDSQVMKRTLTVDESGWVTFFVNTVGAAPGTYTATVSVNPSASVSFEIGEAEPLRIQEGGGTTYNLVGGGDGLIYLPVIGK